MTGEQPTDAQTIESLLDAYRRGYFPMAEPRSPWKPLGASHIYWPSPDPRGILPLTPELGLHVPRRLDRRIRARPFDLRTNTAFAQVIDHCAKPRKPHDDADTDEGAWIDPTITRWFNLLHHAGHAHSIEAWATDPATGQSHLLGGLYGLALGAAFFGESMFHLPQPRLPNGARHPLDGTDAGNICLITLARHLCRLGFTLFDTQMVTTHVARFGAVEIPRVRYLQRLFRAVAEEERWRGFRAH